MAGSASDRGPETVGAAGRPGWCDPGRGFLFPDSHARIQPYPRQEVLGRVCPHREGAGTARGSARGLRRTARTALRAVRREPGPDHRQRSLGCRRNSHDRPFARGHCGCAGSGDKSLLLGESAAADDTRRIEAALTADGTRIIHLKTLHLGPEELLVAAKISVDRNETGARIAGAINAAEERIREAVPIVRLIYLERDVYADRPPQQAAADSSDPAGR